MTDTKKSNDPDIKEILERGRREFYADIVRRIESGKATHQELTLMHKLLQEAGMTYQPDTDETRKDIVEKAKADLPEFPEEDEE